MRLISAEQFDELETHLSATLGRIFQVPGLRPVNERIVHHVMAGGKRIRPQLCMWTCEKLRENEKARRESNIDGTQLLASSTCSHSQLSLMDTACAWELFHAFLLVHDDIIDRADERRGEPTLHRQLAALDHHCPQFGINLAIVAGDLLFTGALQIWHDLDIAPDAYRRLLRLISRVACATGFGQAIDIVQSQVPLDHVREELLIREYLWKTAAYTFEGPMLSGAILAGADDAALTGISRYAMAVGEAYQLQNDLLDLSVPAHQGCDLLEGKRTITLLRARADLNESRRKDFDEQVRRIGDHSEQAIDIAESVRQIVLATTAVENTRDFVERLLREATVASDDRLLPISLRDGMRELLQSLRLTYFKGT